MDDATRPVLSYGTRQICWRPRWALLPLGAGLIVGVAFELCCLAFQPQMVIAADSLDWLWLLATVVITALTWPYTLAALFLLCCFSTRKRLPAPWQVTATIGAALPLLPLIAGVFLHVVCVATGMARVESIGLTAVAVLALIFGLSAPALIVRCEVAGTSRRRRNPTRRMAVAVAATHLLLTGLIVVWRHMESATTDRECGQLAAWVKTTYPVAGSHPGLKLPPKFSSLAADGAVDAAVLADGRVVLLLKTSFMPHHGWFGIVYCSGPIQPGEIGTELFGRPQLLIPGLSYHVVSHEVDKRHFAVRYDLG